MVLGEPQILGQVKDAWEAAQAAGTLGSHLGRCVHRAFSVAKRVRSETSLGVGLVSISSVAVDLAKRIFGDLAGHSVLLLGAGEMAEQAAKSLGKGARELRVCNRSYDRGAALAQNIGAEVAPWSALEPELVRADVVIVSTASPTYVVGKDMVKRVARARRGRILFLIDITVPRNVDPAVHAVENVYVYNIDDLEQQPCTILDRSSVRSCSSIASIAQKFVEQVSIGAMNFNAIESRCLRVVRGLAEACDDAGQLIIAKLARNLVRLFALRRVRFVVLNSQGTWRDGLRSIVQQ
jgi:glutamyl-tRNA reductase